MNVGGASICFVLNSGMHSVGVVVGLCQFYSIPNVDTLRGAGFTRLATPRQHRGIVYSSLSELGRYLGTKFSLRYTRPVTLTLIL